MSDHPKRCEATDYPVWSDGTQSALQCRLIAGHQGEHVADVGSEGITWRFSGDSGEPS